MSVLVTQEVLEVVVSPTTAAVRSSQEVLEVVINTTEAENPQVLPLSVSTSSCLPDGTTGTAYSQDLSATGGTAPYTWAVTVGTLPAGLSLSGSTITGTPSAAGTSTFTVQATDAAARTATQALSITIAAAPEPPAPPAEPVPYQHGNAAMLHRLIYRGGR